MLVSALLALTLATLRLDVEACTRAAEEAARLDRKSRRTFSSIADSLAAHASASYGDLGRAVPLLRESIAQLARSGNRQSLALTLGTTADAVAEAAPDLTIDLACIAESGVITEVGILTNEQYGHVRALAIHVRAGGSHRPTSPVLGHALRRGGGRRARLPRRSHVAPAVAPSRPSAAHLAAI